MPSIHAHKSFFLYFQIPWKSFSPIEMTEEDQDSKNGIFREFRTPPTGQRPQVVNARGSVPVLLSRRHTDSSRRLRRATVSEDGKIANFSTTPKKLGFHIHVASLNDRKRKKGQPNVVKAIF